MWSYLRIPDHITITPATGFAILFPKTPHNREVSIKNAYADVRISVSGKAS